MSESKPHQFRPPLYHHDTVRGGASRKAPSNSHERGKEQQGWDAYRKWLSTVSAKSPAERTPIDHSIYSWKGYHSWADKIKQSWEPEEK